MAGLKQAVEIPLRGEIADALRLSDRRPSVHREGACPREEAGHWALR